MHKEEVRLCEVQGGLAMLHYVRGDGGMIVVPKEELVRWLREKDGKLGYSDHDITCSIFIDHLLAELEAMGR